MVTKMVSRDNVSYRGRRLRSEHRAGAFARCHSGVSAVEFALVLPIVIFSFLATVDIGLALYERMALDHVLRAGSASAMADQDKILAGSVLNVLETTKAESLPATEGLVFVPPPVRYYACPEAPDVSVPATTTCADDNPTSIFYRLSAKKSYNGLFLPLNIGSFELLGFELSATTKVQVR